MACTTVESGPKVSLTYTEETDCGTTPPAVTVPVTTVEADKSGAASGEMNFEIATGDFAADHNIRKWQYIETAGFVLSSGTNNQQWRVLGVSGASPSIVRVEDPDALGTDEVAAGGQTIQIVMRTLRATSRQLDVTKDLLESEEVRQSRQVADQRHGFRSVEGSPGFEMSLVSYSDMLRAAFAADDWVTPTLTATGNLGITGATPMADQATIDRATLTWDSDGIRAGDIITTASFVNAENNRQWRVLSVDAANMVVYDIGDTAITEAAGAGPVMTYPGSRIDIGVGTPRTFTFEQRFDGVTQYRQFVGVACNGFSMNITPDSVVGGDLELLGMDGTQLFATSINALTPIAPPLNAPFAAFDGSVFDGTAKSDVVTSLEFSINNNYALEGVVGSYGSPGVFDGTMQLEGTLTVFLEDGLLYNKFMFENETSLWTRLQDPNDSEEFMNIVIPRLKYNTAEIDPPQSGPVPISMGFAGLEATVKDIDGSDIPSTITIQSTTV